MKLSAYIGGIWGLRAGPPDWQEGPAGLFGPQPHSPPATPLDAPAPLAPPEPPPARPGGEIPPAGAAPVPAPARRPHSAGRIEVALGGEPPVTMAGPALESLRLSIPAARCLPLLSHLARADAGRTVLEYLDVSSIVVNVAPCV